MPGVGGLLGAAADGPGNRVPAAEDPQLLARQCFLFCIWLWVVCFNDDDSADSSVALWLSRNRCRACAGTGSIRHYGPGSGRSATGAARLREAARAAVRCCGYSGTVVSALQQLQSCDRLQALCAGSRAAGAGIRVLLRAAVSDRLFTAPPGAEQQG